MVAMMIPSLGVALKDSVTKQDTKRCNCAVSRAVAVSLWRDRRESEKIVRMEFCINLQWASIPSSLCHWSLVCNVNESQLSNAPDCHQICQLGPLDRPRLLGEREISQSRRSPTRRPKGPRISARLDFHRLL